MASGPTRRRVLAASGTALAGALAGCGASLARVDRREVELARLRVHNNHHRPHTVDVLLLEAGEPVYLDSCTAPPFDESDRQSGGCALEAVPARRGAYRLFVRDRERRGEWHRLDVTGLDLGERCVEVDLWLDDGGALDVDWHPC